MSYEYDDQGYEEEGGYGDEQEQDEVDYDQEEEQVYDDEQNYQEGGYDEQGDYVEEEYIPPPSSSSSKQKPPPPPPGRAMSSRPRPSPPGNLPPSSSNVTNSSSQPRIRPVANSVISPGLEADPDTFTYRDQLSHQVPLLNNQMEAGLAVIHRFQRFMKKIGTIQKKLSLEMLSIYDKELEKKDQITKDAHQDHVKVMLLVQDYIQEVAQKNLAMAENLLNNISSPLEDFYNEHEKKRVEYAKTYSKKAKETDSLNKECEKSRASCMDVWKNLSSTNLTMSRLTPEEQKEQVGFFNKQERLVMLTEKREQYREKALEQFTAFEERGSYIYDTVTRFRGEELPQWLDDMQSFELARLNILKSKLQNFADASHDFSSPSSFPDKFSSKVEKLNPDVSFADQVMQWVFQRGVPPEPQIPDIELPCSAADLQSDAYIEAAAGNNGDGSTTQSGKGRRGLKKFEL